MDIGHWLFIILTVLTIAIITGIITSVIKGSEFWLDLTLWLLIVIVFGWGLLGTGIDASSKTSEVVLPLMSNKELVAATLSGKVVFESVNVSDYNILSKTNSYTFIKTEDLNMYGGANTVTYTPKHEK